MAISGFKLSLFTVNFWFSVFKSWDSMCFPILTGVENERFHSANIFDGPKKKDDFEF